MERLHGTDLATRLRAEPRLPSDELVVLLDQVGARARGRAASPASSIAISSRTTCSTTTGATWKILDFGVVQARGQRGHADRRGHRRHAAVHGARAGVGRQVTHHADVYALGAIAYRCLTGRSPFKGKDLAELVYQVVHQPPVRPGLLGRCRPSSRTCSRWRWPRTRGGGSRRRCRSRRRSPPRGAGARSRSIRRRTRGPDARSATERRDRESTSYPDAGRVGAAHAPCGPRGPTIPSSGSRASKRRSAR